MRSSLDVFEKLDYLGISWHAMITRFLWWYIFWGTIYYIKPYFAVIYYKRKTRNIVIVFLYSIVVWIRPIVNGKKPLQFHRDLIPFPFSIMRLPNKVKVRMPNFLVLPTLRILIPFWSETNSLFIQMCIRASCDSRLETLQIFVLFWSWHFYLKYLSRRVIQILA